ncbi:unnamed protein product [Vitrella brassicaformis CCMP3155]|uniref:Uncharacterized protein n=1 Tax=Vitrella brassicaformis (strain CCMP3155) TaxID=1169540 RepID=A0A0G4GL46_VITBC|nr:unnamed protein product [Vitrella brassicaformis CCMP3155]|eukprot:CEM30762.1 unnamed protein product [Vitrella brassicaformis CCMP3155]
MRRPRVARNQGKGLFVLLHAPVAAFMEICLGYLRHLYSRGSKNTMHRSAAAPEDEQDETPTTPVTPNVKAVQCHGYYLLQLLVPTSWVQRHTLEEEVVPVRDLGGFSSEAKCECAEAKCTEEDFESCRETAATTAHECMEAHWEDITADLAPEVCNRWHYDNRWVDNYAITNLDKLLRDAVCAMIDTEVATLNRAMVYAVTYGDPGCEKRNLLGDLKLPVECT